MKQLLNKIVFLNLAILLVISFIGCDTLKAMFTTEVVSYENEITLSCDSEILDYLPYDNIETFTLTFDGSLNFTKERQGEFECIFYDNDDFYVSRLIKSLINTYLEKDIDRVMVASISNDKDAEVWMNRREDDINEKVYLKVKDETVYNEIVYILLDNGLILSINYARFIDSDNVTYYKWQKTESIRMVLHYPFMITDKVDEYPNKINNNKSFVFIPLPLGVTYSFDTTTKRLVKLLSNDKFLESSYYTYKYVNSYEEDHDNFISFYQKYYNGRYINDEFVVTNFGIDFKIKFNKDNFVITL